MLLPFAKKKTDHPAPAGPLTYFGFIPYYCHHDAHTLLTKNGELMQTIKITTNSRGLEYEGGDAQGSSLRDIVRKAIVANVRDDNVSIWIHTLRKRRQVDFDVTFKEDFAGYVHNHWHKKHRWTHQYYNEIYVTVLHDGHSAKLTEPTALKHVAIPSKNRAWCHTYLTHAQQVLDKTAAAIVATIAPYYDAHRLSAVERLPTALDPLTAQTAVFSEPLEFLGNLLNLRPEEYLLPDLDLSVALHTNDILFGFNAMETKNADGVRRFAALMTLKQYLEAPAEALDHVLQAPIELIVSEAFHFVSEKEALKQYREQRELFQISGDSYSIKATGIEEMLKGSGTPLGYGMHQTSIAIIADEYKQLDAEVATIQQAFAKLGLITVREDIKMEECFWAQLPGNFEFLRRKKPIRTTRIGGFCRLNRFPGGQVDDTHWGKAVALLPTVVNSPYFFNFHHRDNGHTALFDFNSFNDPTANVLLNFLLCETRKYDGKLFVFDRYRSSELFFNKLGGQYHHLAVKPGGEQPQMLLNPFWLDDSKRNQSFLLAWCASLLAPSLILTDAHKEILRQGIAALYQLTPEQRNLPGLVARIATLDPALAKAFAPWHGNGAFAGLLDGANENLDLRRKLHAFDMDDIIAHPESVIPLFSYLLHRIVTTIDGSPSIIVLHEAWDLLENAFFAPRLESLLEMLKQSNVMVVFTTKKPFDCPGSHVLQTVMKNTATQIYVPDDIALDYAADALGLSAPDAKTLLRLDRQGGEFLIKQNHESIALRADMKGLDDIAAIFASNIKNLMAAGGPYASLSDKDKAG